MDLTEREQYKLSMLAEVATMYYERGMTQSEIADVLCISRTRISRLLQEAQEKGIVRININYNLVRHYELERRLCETFQLKDAYVFNNRGKTPSEIADGVARLAAFAIQERLRKDSIVGITWGNTVASTVNAMTIDHPIRADVVQLIGSIASTGTLSSPQEIICKFADLTGATPHFLSVPFIIHDDYIRRAILRDVNNAKALHMSTFCDLIVTGLGTLQYAATTNSWVGYMNEEYVQDIRAHGGVGCLCGRFFDESGQEIDCSWNRDCVGITLEQLGRISEVICVASSPEKSSALHAALKGRKFNILVTDGTTATLALKAKTVIHPEDDQ